MKRIMILLALVCAVAGTQAAEKQVYKWTDANGVVHYSDAPPPKDALNVRSVHLVGATTATTPIAAAGDDKAKAGATQDAAKPATAGVPDTPENRAKECDQAKRNLALLQSSYAVNEIGPDGQAKPIDEKDRESRIEGVKERIAQFCGQ